jgi:hypothetical protein
VLRGCIIVEDVDSVLGVCGVDSVLGVCGTDSVLGGCRGASAHMTSSTPGLPKWCRLRKRKRWSVHCRYGRLTGQKISLTAQRSTTWLGLGLGLGLGFRVRV